MMQSEDGREAFMREHHRKLAQKKLQALPRSGPTRTVELIRDFMYELHDKDKLQGVADAYDHGDIGSLELGDPLLHAYIGIKDPLVSLADVAQYMRIARDITGPLCIEGDKVPSVPVTLYRGATSEYACGVSWTTRYDKALEFAKRSNGSVYEVQVTDENAILGACTKQGEYEVLLDPNLIRVHIQPAKTSS